MSTSTFEQEYRYLKDLMEDDRIHHDPRKQEQARRIINRLKPSGFRNREVATLESELDGIQASDQAVVMEEGDAPSDNAREDPTPRKIASRFQVDWEVQEKIKDIVDVLEDARRPTPRRERGRGVTLKGPPGVGKSDLAEGIAQATDAYVCHMGGSSFSSLMHGPSREWAEAFADVSENAPAVLIIDEAEGMLGRRSELGGSQDQKKELSAEILRTTARTPPGVVLVAITNHPDLLDPAYLRRGRFGDIVIEIQPPSRPVRKAILYDRLIRIPGLDEEDARSFAGFLARETEGFTGADLVGLVETAQDLARFENFYGLEPKVRTIDEVVRLVARTGGGQRPPTLQHFQHALREVGPAGGKAGKRQKQRPPAPRMTASDTNGGKA